MIPDVARKANIISKHFSHEENDPKLAAPNQMVEKLYLEISISYLRNICSSLVGAKLMGASINREEISTYRDIAWCIRYLDLIMFRA